MTDQLHLPGFSVSHEPVKRELWGQQLISRLKAGGVSTTQLRELFCIMLLLEWASERRGALDLQPPAGNEEPESADLSTALFSYLDPSNWYDLVSLKPQLEGLGATLSRAARVPGSRYATVLKMLGEAVSRVALLRAADVEYVSCCFTPHEDEKGIPLRLLQMFDQLVAEMGNGGHEFFTPREWVRKLVCDVSGPSRAIEASDASMSTELFLARVAEYAVSAAVSGERAERDLPYDAFLNDHEFLVGLTRYVLSVDCAEKNSGVAAESFDFVLTNPPFGHTVARTIRQRSGSDVASVSSPESFFIERVLKTMRPSSRAAIIVPVGFLTSESSATLRQRLIEGGILESVILLPPGIFPEAPKVRTAILGLVYRRVEGVIQIIDASLLEGADGTAIRFERAPGPRTSIHLCALRAEGGGEGIPCDSEFVDVTQLAAKSWKLEMSRQERERPSWVDSELGSLLGEQHRIVPLKKHARLRLGRYVKNKCLESAARPAESIGYVRISDFDDGGVQEPTSWFLADKVKGVAAHLLKTGDVLVSRSGTIGKAVAYTKLTKPAIACGGIYVIEVDSSILDRDFLVAYIQSASCQQLLQGIARRTVYPNLRKENMLSLEVPLPVMEVQRSVATDARKTGEDLLVCLAKVLGASLRIKRVLT